MNKLSHDIPDEVYDMLFEYEYRTHYHLSEAQYAEESWESKWLTRTVWALREERANLDKESGSPNHN